MRNPATEAQARNLLRRASPRLKLAFTLGVVVGTVLLPRTLNPYYWIPAALLLLNWALAGFPIAHVLRRMLIAQLFIVGVCVLSLLSRAGVPVFWGTLVKSNLCVFAMVLLTWTTPFQQLLEELRRLKLPSVMLTTLALMYRYLPVLADESRRMQRARASRTFIRSRRLAWHSLSTIVGQLFIRSADRAERIYLAMCARGWK